MCSLQACVGKRFCYGCGRLFCGSGVRLKNVWLVFKMSSVKLVQTETHTVRIMFKFCVTVCIYPIYFSLVAIIGGVEPEPGPTFVLLN